MKPNGNGLVALHDDRQKERGFNCMRLIAYLTADGVTEWGRWHGAHMQAAAGDCPYADICHIHSRTVKRIGAKQLSLI